MKKFILSLQIFLLALFSSVYSQTITIPVVFHIVYSNAAQNIPDLYCQYQLDQLNLDFARLNPDLPVSNNWNVTPASTNIRFCLAKRDPNGKTSSGIERRQTIQQVSWTNTNTIKSYSTGGMDIWDPTKYLNIWVCNMAGGGTIVTKYNASYSTLPPTSPQELAVDGIVLHYETVGSVNNAAPGGSTNPNLYGRVGTREVAHWAGLPYLWGNSTPPLFNSGCGASDNCNDTPPQTSPSPAGVLIPPIADVCSPVLGKMYINFMDWSNDIYRVMFTPNQATLINNTFIPSSTTFNSNRYALLTSLGCLPPAGCGSPSITSITFPSSTSATLTWSIPTGSVPINYTVSYSSSVSSTVSVTVASTTTTLTGLVGGITYNYTITANCTDGNGIFLGTFTVPGTCPQPTSLSVGSITFTSAVISWTAPVNAVSSTLQVKPSTTPAWGAPNLTVSVPGNGSINYTVTQMNATTPLTPGTTYNWRVLTVCAGGSSSYVTGSNFTTTGSCPDPYEPNNSFSTAATIPTNTNITAKINSSSDQDWFKFTTSGANTNVKIDLTTLPQDYDIKLYDSNGALLGTSSQSGTTSEFIIYNISSTDTYYIQVYPYDPSVFDPNVCYTLRASVSNIPW